MAWNVDRLGRSLKDLVGFLSELHALGIDLFLHQQGLDTTTPAGKAMFQMLGVCRVRSSARAATRSEGVPKGDGSNAHGLALATRGFSYGPSRRRALIRPPANSCRWYRMPCRAASAISHSRLEFRMMRRPLGSGDRPGGHQIRSELRRPITAPQISRTIMAPTTAPMRPAPSPGWYHPKT